MDIHDGSRISKGSKLGVDFFLSPRIKEEKIKKDEGEEEGEGKKETKNKGGKGGEYERVSIGFEDTENEFYNHNGNEYNTNSNDDVYNEFKYIKRLSLSSLSDSNEHIHLASPSDSSLPPPPSSSHSPRYHAGKYPDNYSNKSKNTTNENNNAGTNKNNTSVIEGKEDKTNRVGDVHNDHEGKGNNFVKTRTSYVNSDDFSTHGHLNGADDYNDRSGNIRNVYTPIEKQTDEYDKERNGDTTKSKIKKDKVSKNDDSKDKDGEWYVTANETILLDGNNDDDDEYIKEYAADFFDSEEAGEEEERKKNTRKQKNDNLKEEEEDDKGDIVAGCKMEENAHERNAFEEGAYNTMEYLTSMFSKKEKSSSFSSSSSSAAPSSFSSSSSSSSSSPFGFLKSVMKGKPETTEEGVGGGTNENNSSCRRLSLKHVPTSSRQHPAQHNDNNGSNVTKNKQPSSSSSSFNFSNSFSSFMSKSAAEMPPERSNSNTVPSTSSAGARYGNSEEHNKDSKTRKDKIREELKEEEMEGDEEKRGVSKDKKSITSGGKSHADNFSKFEHFLDSKELNVSQASNQSALSPSAPAHVDDIILVVHGIGSSDKSVYSHRDELRQSLEFIKQHWFWNVDIHTHVELVNWKKIILDAQNHIFDQISLDTMPETRKIINLSAADLMCFMTPRYGDFIVHHVAHEINSLIRKLKMDPSGRFKKSRVNLIGYSLGSAICYEILTGKPIRCSRFDSAETSEEFPKIEYPIENFFVLGSSLSAFLLLHSPNLLHGGFWLPKGMRFYNLFHSHDPLAFRIERLIYHDREILPNPVLLPYWRNNGVRNWYEWDKNMQTAKNVIVQNLNEFASSISKSIFGWWGENKHQSALDSNLAHNDEAKKSDKPSKDLIQYRSRLRAAASKESGGKVHEKKSKEEKYKKGVKKYEVKYKEEETPSTSLGTLPSDKQEIRPHAESNKDTARRGDSNEASLAGKGEEGGEPGEKEGKKEGGEEQYVGEKQRRGSTKSVKSEQGEGGQDNHHTGEIPHGQHHDEINKRNSRKERKKDKLRKRQMIIDDTVPSTVWSLFPPSDVTAKEYHPSDWSSVMTSDSGGELKSSEEDDDDDLFSPVAQLRKLNKYHGPHLPCRYDFQLQEDTTEHYLSSLAIVQSHFNYWRLKDVAFFILKCLTKREPSMSYPDYLKKLEAEARLAAAKAGDEANESERLKLEKVANERHREAEAATRKERSEAAADDLKALSTENNPFLRKNSTTNVSTEIVNETSTAQAIPGAAAAALQEVTPPVPSTNAPHRRMLTMHFQKSNS